MATAVAIAMPSEALVLPCLMKSLPPAAAARIASRPALVVAMSAVRRAVTVDGADNGGRQGALGHHGEVLGQVSRRGSPEDDPVSGLAAQQRVVHQPAQRRGDRRHSSLRAGLTHRAEGRQVRRVEVQRTVQLPLRQVRVPPGARLGLLGLEARDEGPARERVVGVEPDADSGQVR
jgi:hypothetical protein